MIKRPTSNETEEDLLKYQKEFFSSCQASSVTVRKCERTNERDVVQLFGDKADNNTQSENLPKSHNKGVHFKITADDLAKNENAAKRLDEKDKEHISKVLTDIQELDVKHSYKFQVDHYENGFPIAPKLQQPTVERNGKQTGSLFAQQFQTFSRSGVLGKKLNTEAESKHTERDVVGYITGDDIALSKSDACPPKHPEPSLVKDKVLSSSELSAIHQENLNRLSQMSERDILQQRTELLKSLDPQLVSFLRKKSYGNEKQEQPGGNGSTKANSKTKANKSKENQNVNSDRLSSKEHSLKEEEEVDEIANDSVDPFAEFNIKKDYVNMTCIEKEKLAWMKDVPIVKLNQSDTLPRFDFEGNLMPPDSNIPMYVGLHHHGNEPGSPGYTLEELFQMSRSKFPKQRVLSLQTLGRIIEKYHQHMFEGKLSTDLLKQCLHAGLIFILRWSMDEHAEQIYSIAIAVLAYIVYVPNDQNTVDDMLYTEEGCKCPSLCTYYKKSESEMTQEEREENRDLTDAELLQIDVIKGLLQIQILPRLRYVMEICQPSDAAVTNCMKVLIRMAQHNKETAFQLFKTPRLLDVVFTIMKTTNSANEDNYSFYALKLVRILCTAGKNMAAIMISNHKLDEVIAVNISSKAEQRTTFMETCHVWRILLLYGLKQETVRDLHSSLIVQLQQVIASSASYPDKYLAAMVQLVSVIVSSAPKGCIDWALVNGLFQLILHCIHLLQKDLLRIKKVTQPFFLSSVLQCCSAYFRSKNKMVTVINPVDFLDEAEKFWQTHLQIIFDTPLFYELIEDMRLFSDFKHPKESTNEVNYTTLENLPNYGTYILQDCTPLSLRADSPVVLVQSILKLSLDLIKIHKSLIIKALPVILSPEMTSYLKFILQSTAVNRCSVLITTRIELLLLVHLVEMFETLGQKFGFQKFGLTLVNIYQEIAFLLITLLQPGDENRILALFRKVIFNNKLFRKQTYVLWLPDHFESTTELKDQLNMARKDLPAIGSIYEKIFFPGKSTDESSTDTSFMTSSRRSSCMPQDWMFYPIIELYNLSIHVEQHGGIISQASEHSVFVIKKCLQFLLLLEATRNSLVVHIKETLRYTRLMCLFLTEGELYKEELLKDLIFSLTLLYCSPAFQSYLEFETTIPGVTSFYDIYCSFLQQYISSSFGDYTFANLVLVPMTLQHDVKYRRAVWTEYSDALRIFPLPLKKVSCDIKKFLAADNEDEEMVKIYFQALLKAKVSPTWCPVFYLIAIHHVNQFIFLDQQSDGVKNAERKRLLDGILTLPENVKEAVIYYQSYDSKCEHGILKFKQLPPSREILLRQHVTSREMPLRQHVTP